MKDMILFRMLQYRFRAFDVAGTGFYFNQSAFSPIADHKIHFQTAVLVEIVEFSPHFSENVSNQVFKNCSLIAVEISPQDVILCAIFQHTDKKSGRLPSYLEAVEPFFTTEY